MHPIILQKPFKPNSLVQGRGCSPLAPGVLDHISNYLHHDLSRSGFIPLKNFGNHCNDLNIANLEYLFFLYLGQLN